VHERASSRMANVSWFCFPAAARATNSAAAAAVANAVPTNALPSFVQSQHVAPPAKSDQLRLEHRLPASKAQRAPPNPSLKLTHYGVRCKPGALHMVHHRAPGLQHTPPWAT
jgi:hypothetical protein